MSRTTKADFEKANAELAQSNARLRESNYKLEANLRIAVRMLDEALNEIVEAKKNGPEAS